MSSDQTPENSCPDDASSNGAKDDDEDEDEDDDKLDGLTCGDPEKLKAFNVSVCLPKIHLMEVYSKLQFFYLQMFVRLFVDENLDRHVPISKQPKEKIQAIIDSCTRQFPEYASRARKRIRTYLKSCRRTKRSREQAGLDSTNVRSSFRKLVYVCIPILFTCNYCVLRPLTSQYSTIFRLVPPHHT